MVNASNQPKTTREMLILNIDLWLAKHPDIDAESFGWKAVADSSAVGRLKAGGDITTRKLDTILAFMHKNP